MRVRAPYALPTGKVSNSGESLTFLYFIEFLTVKSYLETITFYSLTIGIYNIISHEISHEISHDFSHNYPKEKPLDFSSGRFCYENDLSRSRTASYSFGNIISTHFMCSSMMLISAEVGTFFAAAKNGVESSSAAKEYPLSLGSTSDR